MDSSAQIFDIFYFSIFFLHFELILEALCVFNDVKLVFGLQIIENCCKLNQNLILMDLNCFNSIYRSISNSMPSIQQKARHNNSTTILTYENEIHENRWAI